MKRLLTLLLYLPLAFSISPQESASDLQKNFVHRGYLGWVRDLASEPRPGEEWPVISIDQQLIRDYDSAATTLSRDGINEFEIWGLLASHSYPATLPLRFPEERILHARAIVGAVRRHGIRVLAGTGIYSWGFDAIAATHPEIACPNSRQLVNPTEELSWQFQRAIIDALFSLGVDGIELQPGDQGRCQCGPRCAALGDDAAYYATIIQQSTRYVRDNYPGKLLFIGGYGIDLSHPANQQQLNQVLRGLDVYTDVGNTTAAFRKRVTAQIHPAALAGIAAPGISPPQHLARDHWFLPTFQHQVRQLQALYADGGRASENFMRIFANPSDAISMRLIARYEINMNRDWCEILRELVREIYEPRDEETTKKLASLFIDAESAYFDNAQANPDFDLELEPLIGSQAAPLTYLTKKMKHEQRVAYQNRLRTILSNAQEIQPKVRNQAQMSRILICLRNVISDIDTVNAAQSE